MNDSKTHMRDDQIVLTLRLEPDGVCYAKRFDLSNALTQVRLAFRQPTPLKDVFNHPADSVIYDLVRQATGRVGVLLKPDFHLRIGGLVLTAARVLLTSAPDGGEQIMIRFGRFVGDLSCLFRAHVINLLPRSTVRHDEVVLKTLEEFVLPVLNFGHYLDEAIRNLETQNIPRLRRILENVRARINVLDHTHSKIVRNFNQTNGPPIERQSNDMIENRRGRNGSTG